MTFYWLAASYLFELLVGVGFVAWLVLGDGELARRGRRSSRLGRRPHAP
jgi:phosphatidylglycerophosphate synthase